MKQLIECSRYGSVACGKLKVQTCIPKLYAQFSWFYRSWLHCGWCDVAKT